MKFYQTVHKNKNISSNFHSLREHILPQEEISPQTLRQWTNKWFQATVITAILLLSVPRTCQLKPQSGVVSVAQVLHEPEIKYFEPTIKKKTQKKLQQVL